MAVASDHPADYVATLYQLEDLEGWQLFARHLELTEGFSFAVVLAPDDQAIEYVRSQLSRILPGPDAVRRVVFDPSAGESSLTESLLMLPPLPDCVRVVWIDANPAAPESFALRDKAWGAALARLNRHRNTIQSSFNCTLVLAGPVNLQTIARTSAPDLWSIRSGVFRIEPAGTATAALQSLPPERRSFLDGLQDEVSGDPTLTLAEANRIRGQPDLEVLLVQLLQRAGRQAAKKLQWDVAVKCLEEAYAIDEAHGGDPEVRFEIGNDLAFVFFQKAEYGRALHYGRRAVETMELKLGSTNARMATALTNFALLLQNSNQLAEAESPLRRALAIEEMTYGAEHPNVALRLNNLAALLHEATRRAEAEPLMRRALAIDEKTYGAEHPNVATGLNNLAQLLQETNRLVEAEVLMRRALAINEKTYGTLHPKVAIRLNNLARLLMTTNRMAEAEPLIRRALAIDESYGPEHPRVAVRLNNLAQLLQNTNQLAEAEPLMRRALAIDQKSYGPEHTKVAIRCSNLAQLLLETNHLVEAEPLARRAAEIFLAFGQRNGLDHPQVQTALANFTRMLETMGRTPADVQAELDRIREGGK